MTLDEIAAVVANVIRDYVPAAQVPVIARLAAVETQVQHAGDLRDRLLIMETKTAVPAVVPQTVDLAPLLERLAALESRVAAVGDVRDRVTTLEVKTVTPVTPPVDLAPILERLAAIERRVDLATAAVSTVADLTKDLGAMRERVAVVEVRPLLPGPPGPAGEPGAAGTPGQHGTLDNLKVVRLNEREFEFQLKDGTPIEGGRIKLNHPIFSDDFAYLKGKSYELNTLAQWDGSIWIAVKEGQLQTPGSGSPDVTGWKLLVKRGTNGRDGKDAEPPLPKVRVS